MKTDKTEPDVMPDSEEDKTENNGEKTESQGVKSETAEKLVKRYMYTAMGFGLVPIPIFDLITVSGTQMKMLHALCSLYDVKFNKNVGKKVISALIGGLIPSTLSMPVASLLKTIPLIGQTTGSIAMPALAGASTYAVGRVFIQHFESGGTLLDFDPEKFKEGFDSLLNEGKKLVKQKLKRKDS